MAITEQQKQDRRKYLGSSEAATVLGLNPFETLADLWLKKTGRVVDDPPNDAMIAGNMLEPVLLRYAAEQLGQELLPARMIVEPSGHLCANIDGELSGNVIVEAKHTGLTDGWGEPGTGEVPPNVAVQVSHQMFCAGAAYELAVIPVALIVGRRLKFQIFNVPRDASVVQGVAEQGMEFMDKYVRRDIRPDDFHPSLSLLAKVKRTANKTVTLDSALFDALILAQAARKAAADAEDEAKAALLAAMEDAVAAVSNGGRHSVTYYQRTRKSYVVKESTFPVLCIKTKE